MGHKRRLRRTDDLKILELYAEGKTQKEIGEVFGVTDVAISLRLKKILPLVKVVKEKRFLSREPLDMQLLQDLKNANTVQEEVHTQCPKTANENNIISPEHNGNNDSNTVMDVVDVEPEEVRELGDLMSACGLNKEYRLQRLKRCIDHPDPGVVLKALDQSWKLDGSYHNDKNINITGINIATIVESNWNNSQRIKHFLTQRARNVGMCQSFKGSHKSTGEEKPRTQEVLYCNFESTRTRYLFDGLL